VKSNEFCPILSSFPIAEYGIKGLQFVEEVSICLIGFNTSNCPYYSMESQIQGGDDSHLMSGSRLANPFKTPLNDMGQMARGWYRLKWAFGLRLKGPASWTRKVRMKLSYERWISSNVSGWSGFLLWRLQIRIPFKAILEGKEYHVRNTKERNEFSRQVRFAYQPSPFRDEKMGEQAGVFRFSSRGKDLAFPYDGNRYGVLTVLKEFFVNEPFAGLDVEGMDVVDIGSSLGDTPIYFAMKGARRVIALEPYPAIFAEGKRNISDNGFEGKVTFLNEGAGASGWMKLSRSEKNLWANAVPSNDGLDVRFNSLNDIIERFGIGTAALKLHGEGCEYELLETATDEDLAHFPQIVLKYHYGASRILKRLRAAGFVILKKWDLHFTYNSASSRPRYEAGFVLAKLPNV
jgi:FkbM family methyltransferase